MSEYDPNYVEPKDFYRIAVKVAVVNNQNEVLILRRSQLSPLPSIWDLPGGAVDAHEAPEAAAIRETIEEAGIEITNPQIIISGLIEGSEEPWVVLGFGARIDETEVVLSWEHDEYIWVPIDDIDSTELPEGYKQVVQAYKASISSQ